MQTDMQKELKKEIKKYLNAVKYLLPGDSGSKRKYISGLKEQIYDFAEDNENITFRDILLHFGEKEVVVQQYIKALDVKTVKRKMGVRRAAVAALVAALVIWSAVMCFVVADAHYASNGYYFERIGFVESNYE